MDEEKSTCPFPAGAESDGRIRSLLTDLLEHSDDLIMIADENGRPRLFNTAYARTVRRALNIEMKPGIQPHKLLDDPAAVQFWDGLHERVLAGETFRTEYTHRFADDDVRHLEIAFCPIVRGNRVCGFSEITRDVTGNKRLEKALAESHEKFKVLFDQSFQLMGILDPKGKLLEANQAALALGDLKPQEILGKPFWRTPWWTHSKKLQARLKQAVITAAAGEMDRFEAFHPMPDGDVRHVDVSIKPVKDASGTVLFLIPEGRDITERRRAEDVLKESEKSLEQKVAQRTADLARANQKLEGLIQSHIRIEESLKESEAKLQALIDHAVMGIARTDKIGRILMINRRGAQIFGFESPARMMETVANIREVYAQPRVRDRIVERLNDTEELKNVVLEGKKRDGRRIQVQLNVLKRPAEDGGFLLESFFEDITDWYAAAEKLRLSETNMRSVLESAAGFAIYRLAYDPSEPGLLRTVFISPSILDILGVHQDAWTSACYFDSIHPEDKDRVKRSHKQAFDTNRFEAIARHYHQQKESWVWIHAISTGIRDAEGNVTHVNGIMIDVTDKKLAEEALKQRESQLADKARNLEELNVAMKVLLKKRDEDRKELEEKIIFNVGELIDPYLQKLKQTPLNESQQVLLRIIRSNLEEIVTPFAYRLATELRDLTPKEIQIANLIRQGRTSKEIGELMGISHRTVETHRRNLRSKMGIRKKGECLASRLMSIT